MPGPAPAPPLAGRVAALLGAEVLDCRRVPGGDACLAHHVRVTGGAGGETTVFVKSLPPGPGADHRIPVFTREAEGLAWLSETGTVRVPRVLAVDDGPGLRDPNAEHGGFLVLELIRSAGPAPDHDERLGRALAGLHRYGETGFGAAHDNMVGALPQDNTPEPTWPELYGRRRIEPLVRRAVAEGRLPPDAAADADRLIARLPELVGPPEPAARLHGDLWAGNAITDERGRPVLVDPAAYGGHREVDLAMMALFGGFSATVTAAYDEVYPRAPGHAERVALYQLYPLLVHTILFDGGYAASARAALRRYR
jgi:fructosamine-3-kinase